MMRVDFYQLSRDPVDKAIAQIAAKAMQAGKRAVVVHRDGARREAISQALWAQDGVHFLAHGEADAPHATRQPILLSDSCDAPNEADLLFLADGIWREEARNFARVLLFFDEDATQAARDLWRQLSGDDTAETHIHKQSEGGGWREGR